MRILVTGANGFLGSALVNLMTLKNVEVIALSTSKFNEIQDLENFFGFCPHSLWITSIKLIEFITEKASQITDTL